MPRNGAILCKALQSDRRFDQISVSVSARFHTPADNTKLRYKICQLRNSTEFPKLSEPRQEGPVITKDILSQERSCKCLQPSPGRCLYSDASQSEAPSENFTTFD